MEHSLIEHLNIDNKWARYLFMATYDTHLRSDKDFNYHVKIKHLDQSVFDLYDVHIQEDSERVYVYTEHCGFFYFMKDEIEDMEKEKM